ncbi:MAG TPA: hypothetical protein VFZ78_03340, partial [Flavisolibacter sp.]
PRSFRDQMLEACEHIIDVISTPGYLQKSHAAIPAGWDVPGEDAHPHCIAFDFGVCAGAGGKPEPRLIEMQGFPSLFAWQVILPEKHREHFWWPDATYLLNDLSKSSYIELLRKVIIADANPDETILLEILPHRQKTRSDFYATEELTGVRTVCLTDVIREGRELFYMRDGRRQKISRIYNRVIFDELFQQPAEIREKGRIFQESLDVTWVPHPNWFYRISKYTMPFIEHPFVPRTQFLDKENLPADLGNYVVKPLFSFAGQGVIIDVTPEAIRDITDPENWIIQEKVEYLPVVETPGDPAKAEIRLFYLWPEGAARPFATNNLARLSKGKMIGVRYNKDLDWVGGSFCLFEK